MIKSISSLFWALIAGMAFVLFLTGVIDRFSNNNSAAIFYSERIDATCLVHRERGQDTMFCLAGDRRVELAGGDE